MITLAGFLVLLTHMSKGFYYFSFISYLRYGLQGLVHSLYGYGRGSIPCPEDAVYCHYKTPDIFLKEIGMSDSNSYWISSLVLLGAVVFLRILAFCTLKRRLTIG